MIDHTASDPSLETLTTVQLLGLLARTVPVACMPQEHIVRVIAMRRWHELRAEAKRRGWDLPIMGSEFQ